MPKIKPQPQKAPLNPETANQVVDDLERESINGNTDAIAALAEIARSAANLLNPPWLPEAESPTEIKLKGGGTATAKKDQFGRTWEVKVPLEEWHFDAFSTGSTTPIHIDDLIIPMIITGYDPAENTTTMISAGPETQTDQPPTKHMAWDYETNYYHLYPVTAAGDNITNFEALTLTAPENASNGLIVENIVTQLNKLAEQNQ